MEWQKCPEQFQSTCLISRGPDLFDPDVMDYKLLVEGRNYAGNTTGDAVTVDAAHIGRFLCMAYGLVTVTRLISHLFCQITHVH